METCAKRLRVPAISLLLAALVLLPSHIAVKASNRYVAVSCSSSDNLFWFLHVSDLHIGARGTTDSRPASVARDDGAERDQADLRRRDG